MITHLLERYRLHNERCAAMPQHLLVPRKEIRPGPGSLARMALRVTRAVEFKGSRVALEDATLRIEFEILNNSAEAWLPEDGWATGYHLFDEPTGTLVVDGERTPLRLAPAETRNPTPVSRLPPEPGEYNIYVSVMREHVAWFYNQGWPFLLIDVRVDDEGVPAISARMAYREQKSSRAQAPPRVPSRKLSCCHSTRSGATAASSERSCGAMYSAGIADLSGGRFGRCSTR